MRSRLLGRSNRSLVPRRLKGDISILASTLLRFTRRRDKYDKEIEDRVYNQKDMDKFLIIEPRTQLVAQKITNYLKATDRYSKTIVFCENIDHAERMRQALR